ncbi:L-aspartate 1-decarboxylase [Melghirimyces profundicolus]|uniref:Aspartate 1-decarboxylase n=1 Tax=Melghirimyces profundicolus TaxID=1242148 RepID=A0A2T6BXL5_9BACL|nr:aspartate 1-decarboxylase [Melghirimyces profundicolus]PTX60822.1 L-aspartate 1-decarboxylase [Melghirimyces profundicolus]
MKRWMCKGKIHHATVTTADLEYEGSITIDSRLMTAADIRPFEMVQVTSFQNAILWKTYAIPSEKEGEIGLNGPPARMFRPGDQVVILSLAMVEDDELEDLKPRVVLVNEQNRIVDVIRKNTELKGRESDG